MPEKAKLRVEDEGGGIREIPLEAAWEIKMKPERRNSIGFNEMKDGAWGMSITTGVMDGKKIRKVELVKDHTPGLATTTKVLSFYSCDNDRHNGAVKWTSLWGCGCDDRCPACRRSTEPYQRKVVSVSDVATSEHNHLCASRDHLMQALSEEIEARPNENSRRNLICTMLNSIEHLIGDFQTPREAPNEP